MPGGTGIRGIILGGCYAMGATAPMIFTGAVAYAAVPDSIFSPAMALPLHLYLLVAQGSTSMDTAYGTAFVMMAMILLSSLLATAYARSESEPMEEILMLKNVSVFTGSIRIKGCEHGDPAGPDPGGHGTVRKRKDHAPAGAERSFCGKSRRQR